MEQFSPFENILILFVAEAVIEALGFAVRTRVYCKHVAVRTPIDLGKVIAVIACFHAPSDDYDGLIVPKIEVFAEQVKSVIVYIDVAAHGVPSFAPFETLVIHDNGFRIVRHATIPIPFFGLVALQQYLEYEPRHYERRKNAEYEQRGQT